MSSGIDTNPVMPPFLQLDTAATRSFVLRKIIFKVNYIIYHGFKNVKPVDLVAIQLGDVHILPHLLPIFSNPGYVGSFGRKSMHVTELSSLFLLL